MHNYVVSSIQCIYAAMERDRVVLNVPRQKQKGETEARELSWPLSCKIWALVDQQDRKKSLSKANSEVLREYSLQVCVTNYRKYFCVYGRKGFIEAACL